MGRSEPGGEKERQLARNATKVVAAGRRRGSRVYDWRPFNEKRLNQARTGLFIQNLCETEHAGHYERVGIFILESPKDLGRLYEMAPVRIGKNAYYASLHEKFFIMCKPKTVTLNKRNELVSKCRYNNKFLLSFI